MSILDLNWAMRTKSTNPEPGYPTRADIYKHAQTKIDKYHPNIPPSISRTAKIIKKHIAASYINISLDRIEQSIMNLTPKIVLVISEELYKQGICRLPGDTFFPDIYHTVVPRNEFATMGVPNEASTIQKLWPCEGTYKGFLIPICRGKLCGNGTYELNTKHETLTFDMNNESDFIKLIQTIILLCTNQEHQ